MKNMKWKPHIIGNTNLLKMFGTSQHFASSEINDCSYLHSAIDKGVRFFSYHIARTLTEFVNLGKKQVGNITLGNITLTKVRFYSRIIF